jgi:hypothetical protein
MKTSTRLVVLLAITMVSLPARAASKDRINLVDFGRVVELADEPTRVTTANDELTRGTDGWDAVRGAAGEYYIGVEWDEPLDICEVNIEFRHAIADREQIRVQYFRADNDTTRAAASEAAPVRGRWLTPQADWWAGDRDVSFAFLPQDKDSSDRKNSTESYRRTTRIRFLCGKADLPPVRFLRAYGAGKAEVATFDLRFRDQEKLAPPALVKAINGYILSGDDQVTMESAVVQDTPGTLSIRYFRGDTASPNRTRLLISAVSQPEREVVVVPAEAAAKGRVSVPQVGLVFERRGGQAATRPN